MKHFTIPIFVPELACPNRCVFCNQHSISGCHKQPEPEEVREIILMHLETVPEKGSHIEIGFFGGSFTGIESYLQAQYLAIADEFLKAGRIHGIRLSTRPDYINAESLDLLKKYGVTTIELGAQSLDDEVLQLSGRGHTVADVEKASEMIRSAGFNFGLQMMTGLPGDTPEKSLLTARRIVELGATCTRIYPTLVIRGTELEQLWRNGEYQPQSLDEAVALSAQLLEIFRQGGVEVIRVGLHPSEGLLDGSEMLAGPFHPSFRELAETHSWKQKLIPLLQQHPAGSNLRIPVPARELRNAIGYGSSNRKILEKHFSKVEFLPEVSPDQKRPLIIADKKLPLPAKNVLKTMGEVHLLQTDRMVYKSISGHPDVFMCQGDECVVVAPGLPEEIQAKLMETGINIISGQLNPGKAYPDSARYNAVVTDEFIIHNLKITDPAIIGSFPGRKPLHVNQGYTRCNLLALTNDHFITSDRGIEKALLAESKTVLFVDPAPVRLKGQQYGFFPGCCGILLKEVLINGSLKYHPQGGEIRDFINNSGLVFRELFDGVLTDVGGIFVLADSLISRLAD
jgi:radical SAM superfamily enzyme